MKKKQQIISLQNKKEIFYNIVDSAIVGAIFFTGALSTGHLDMFSIVLAGISACATALYKFKTYWESEKKEYCRKTTLLNFL
jgi:hypothetical protein